MANTTFSNVATGQTFNTWRNTYNNVVSELNTGVLRISSVATGNLTINGAVSIDRCLILSDITQLSNTSISGDTTNRLENRNGRLFFNNKEIGLLGRATKFPVFGYAVAGYDVGIEYSDIQTLRFSTGLMLSSFSAVYQRGNAVGFSDGDTAGYAYGGYQTGSGFIPFGEKITFSTGTSTSVVNIDLSQSKGSSAGLSDGETYGYVLGGTTGARVATTDRFNFSTQSIAAHTPANLSTVRLGMASVSDGVTYGYVMGGSTISGASTVYVATTDRITYGTAIVAAYTPGNLSQGREGSTGVSDSITYGYVLGGSTSSTIEVVTADRITFSTGATAASTPANLGSARTRLGGLSDGRAYAYLIAGYSSTQGLVIPDTDRLSYGTGVSLAGDISYGWGPSLVCQGIASVSESAC